MAYQIAPLPVAPTRQDPVNFSVRADAFVGALPLFRRQANDLALYVEATVFAAEQASNAAAWDPLRAYIEGEVVYSPLNYFSYRRKISGTTPDDPSVDTVNWVLISGSTGQIENIQNQLFEQDVRIDTLEATEFISTIDVRKDGTSIDNLSTSINFVGEGLNVTTDGDGNVNINYTGIPIGIFADTTQVTPSLRNINIVSNLGAVTSDALGNVTFNISGELATVITNDVASNVTLFPTLASATSGSNKQVKVSNTKLSFNPSTGTLFSTVFNSSSDINLKKDLSRVKVGEIDKLTGYEFYWKDGSGKSAGVIAQEVEEVLPHLVSEGEQGKTVHYDGIIPYLIEEIKALKQRVKELERG